jgi:hypothetical protein
VRGAWERGHNEELVGGPALELVDGPRSHAPRGNACQDAPRPALFYSFRKALHSRTMSRVRAML